MLYLDKCWNELQVLLGPESGVTDRPALQLVEGRVTDVGIGWIPYERALSPVQVQAVAADLSTVGESDIRRLLPALNRWHDPPEQEYGYVAEYLAAAQQFTAALARSRRGLVYMIG